MAMANSVEIAMGSLVEIYTANLVKTKQLVTLNVWFRFDEAVLLFWLMICLYNIANSFYVGKLNVP